MSLKKITVLSASLFLVTFVVSAIFCLSPLDLSIETETGSTVTAYNQKGQALDLISSPGLSSDTITITNSTPLSQAQREVMFTPPSTFHHGLIDDPTFFKVTHGDWHTWGDFSKGGRYASSWPQSTIELTANTSGLSFYFLRHQNGGIVKVAQNSQTIALIDLYSPHEQWQEVKIPSRQTVYHYKVYPSVGLVRIGQIQTPANLTINLGHHPFLLSQIPIGSATDIDTSLTQRYARLFSPIFFALVRFYLQITTILLFFFIVGFPLVFGLTRKTSLEKITYSIFIGISLLTVITTSLCYFLPVKLSLPIGISAIGLSYLIMAKCKIIPPITRPKISLPSPSSGLLLALNFVIVSFLFFPNITEPGWSLGQSLTDSFHYINLSHLFTKFPPSDSWTIYTFRFAENIFLSIVAFITLSDTRVAYSLSAPALWFLLMPTSYLIFSRLTKKTALAVFISFVSSLLAPVFFLFSLSFFGQYFFIVNSLFLFLLLLNLSDTIDRQNQFLTLLVCGISLSVCIATYPYHLILPISFFIITIPKLIRTRQKKTIIINLFLLTTITIILTNINFAPVINIGKAVTDYRFANDIGKYIVFPFYRQIKDFSSVFLGFSDISANSALSGYILRELGIPQNIFNLYLQLKNKLMAVVLFGFSLTIMAYIKNTSTFKLIIKRITSLIPNSQLWSSGSVLSISEIKKSDSRLSFFFINVIILSLYALILYQADQIYALGKLGFTLGLYLYFFLFALLLSVDNRKPFRLPITLLLSVVIFSNCFSIFYENSTIILNRQSDLLFSTKNHLATSTASLKQFEDYLVRRQIVNSRIVITGNYLDVRKTDKDRVFYNRLLHIVDQKNTAVYLHNQNNAIYNGYDFGLNIQSPLPQAEYLFDFDCLQSTNSLLLKTPLFCFGRLSTN